MQSVSAGFTTASMAQSRKIAMRVYVLWDGVNWTDETNVNGKSYVIDWSFSRKVDAPGNVSLVPPGSINVGSITFDNSTRRYSADFTGGDDSIRSYISGRKGMMGIGVRIDVGFYVSGAAEYIRVFNGYIYHGEPSGDSKFVVNLRGLGFKILQNRINTTIEKDISVDGWISHLASVGGISSSDIDLDASPHTIPYAWCFDDSALQDAMIAAQATGGILYFTATGKLRYLTMATLSNKTSADITIDDSVYIRSRPIPSPDTLTDKVIVNYSPRVPAKPGVIYEMDERQTIPAGETKTFYARLSTPAVSITTPEKITDYWITSIGGEVLNDDVTISTTKYAQIVKIEITNNHSYLAAVIMFFRLRGQSLVGRQTKQLSKRTDDTQPESDDIRVRSMRGNVYLQTDSMARSLLNWLAHRHKYETKMWEITLPAIPQIEIGDLVQFSDARQSPTARSGYVVGYELSYKPATRKSKTNSPLLEQKLTLIDNENMFAKSDYFEIGVDSLGSGSAWY